MLFPAQSSLKILDTIALEQVTYACGVKIEKHMWLKQILSWKEGASVPYVPLSCFAPGRVAEFCFVVV